MQDYPSIGNNTVRVTVTDRLPRRTDSLRSLFSGPDEPADTVPYQLWQDTAGTLWQRDSGDAVWIPCKRKVIQGELRATLATLKLGLVCAPAPLFVESLRLVADATTSASVATTKEYTFDLKNVTASNSMFSTGPISTATVVDSGGGEMTQNVSYQLLANQNQTLAVDDVLQLWIVKNGSPTAVTILAWTLNCWELVP